MLNDTESLIFEKSSEGREGILPPEPDVAEISPEDIIPSHLLRKEIGGFPESSELDLVRHYSRLSQMNFGVDTVFYPLGSCTMKYNPAVNEGVAGLSGFARVHPYTPDEWIQGALELMKRLEKFLAEIGGMDAVSLQPSAGAHGELVGMKIIAAYFKDKGEQRRKVIIPDTAHGTNPASCNLAGFEPVVVRSGESGILSPRSIAGVMDENTAALMLTNPNTLGLFETDVKEITDIVHAKGGLAYCDGANLNAIMGIARPGDMGMDLLHFNLHKTFATPHGGGGPGSGPVGVKDFLAPYLPEPRIVEEKHRYRLVSSNRDSIGRVRAFYGNFAVIVRAYAYIRAMGAAGLRKASEMAVLNANYIQASLKEDYYLPYKAGCMHEAVFSDKKQLTQEVHTIDIAKRLIDYGFHPPTIYFPVIVKGAIMIEPTETESIETIDSFIRVMKEIAREAEETPETVKNAPLVTGTGRIDEVKAARTPVLIWENPEENRN